ncbi:hypothetical protein GCM10010360_41140 [Streptomyces nogalater]
MTSEDAPACRQRAAGHTFAAVWRAATGAPMPPGSAAPGLVGGPVTFFIGRAFAADVGEARRDNTAKVGIKDA